MMAPGIYLTAVLNKNSFGVNYKAQCSRRKKLTWFGWSRVTSRSTLNISVDIPEVLDPAPGQDNNRICPYSSVKFCPL